MDFAHLLDVLHEHSKVENAFAEILGAFEAQDKDKKGLLSAAEVSQVTLGSMSMVHMISSILLHNFRYRRGGI